MDEYLERESKWELAENCVLPSFEDVYDGAHVMRSTIELTSVYYDTAEHDLLAHGMTLRRRAGDTDEGWQLKVPGEDGRTEIRTALSDSVPAAIAQLTRGARLDKELGTVASIHTTRTRYRLFTRDDELIAEVADDQVRATRPQHPGEEMVWREVEVESGPAGDDVSGLVDLLRTAGATESAYPSKLTRALAMEPNEPQPGTASAALTSYLTKQVEVVFAGDVGLRRKLDPIHSTRVAIRRIRSTLRVFAKVLEPDSFADLDAELKWFANEIGRVREYQVQRKRFASALAELDPKLVIGFVATHLDSELLTRQTLARGNVASAINSRRYLTLLAKLSELSAKPPIKDSITEQALRKRAGRAARKADQRLATGVGTGNDDDLHRARKAAKRARYAADLIGAKKKAKRYKKIQRVLGEHQDSVVAAGTLLAIATSQPTPPLINTFTIGVLNAREQRIAADSRAAVSQL